MTEPVHNLPHAQGRSFTQLDDYLDYLEGMAAQDRPFYEEISPGRYRLNRGRRPPGSAPETDTYTRADLLKKYGFDR